MLFFLLGILFETFSRFWKWGATHEQIALLVFGVGLFCLPAVLRFFFKWRGRKSASRTFRDLDKKVAVENH